MSKLVVGLGNPGGKYEFTRHNIGWSVLDNLAFGSELNWQDKFKGVFATYTISGTKHFFLRPMTYMNLSGQSVSALANFYKISVDEILVIHDELDIDLGTIIFKKGGGLAGHNGLKSIASSVGSQNFLRLRLGIGRPVHGSVSSWVLSKYSKDEQMFIDDYFKGAAEAVELFLKEGFEKASAKYSRQSFIK